MVSVEQLCSRLRLATSIRFIPDLVLITKSHASTVFLSQ